jgi:small subunit ribosomal protein S1
MSEELINAPEMVAQNDEQVAEQPVQEENVSTNSDTEEIIIEPLVDEKPVDEGEPLAMEEPEKEEPEKEEPEKEEPEKEESKIEELPLEDAPFSVEKLAMEVPAITEKLDERESLLEDDPVATIVEKPLISKTPFVTAYDSLEEFNWDNLEKKGSKYSATEKERYAELYTKSFKSIDENAVIKGTIVSINIREIVVNIGFKSDGVITASELRYKPDIQIGDEIEVYVENQEDATGQLQLSHKKARMLQSWNRVNQAHDDNEIITGYVKCRTKGGLIVDVFGIEAFLPGSQIDVKPIRDYDIYVNKTMEFKVVKINHEYKNVVVSHKALIEDELEAQKAEIIARLEKGQILEGVVKNITSYGVFIDLGGVDGLIHITDLSWGRINHPEEIVQ